MGALPSNTTLRQFLFQVKPFRDLPSAEIDRLACETKERQLEKGETIYCEGDVAERVWIVRSGRVEILKYSCDGRPFAIETLGSGELFGTLCRIASHDTRYPCSAISETACSVIEIPDRLFHQLYHRYTSVMASVCSLCSQRLSSMQAFGCAAQEPVRRRIAGILVRLTRTYGDTVPCTKRELAELAGTSIETAIRIVSSFARKGWVQSMRGKITIKDVLSLEKLLKPLN